MVEIVGKVGYIAQNRGVIELTEPQVWTLIGVFAAGLFGTLTLVSTMFIRILRAEIGAVRTEMRAEIGAVRTEVGAVRAEVGALKEIVHHLDRDVQAITRRVFPE